MFDNLVSLDNISFVLVFLEGLISFLSPCVIPLIPIYMSYLAGNAKHTDESGAITYRQKTVFFHTVFFILGISFSFFLLGMAFTALGSFFKTNQLLFTRIGGILITLLGLFQVGLFNVKFLQKERKFRFIPDEINPLMAFLMGFTFSFAWTPCVGPALSSVLILASSSKSALTGYLLVLLYTAGFIIPFLILGLFTTQVLNFLKSKQKILKYTVKIGGLILILIGIMTFTGWMNGISKYLNKISRPLGVKQEQQTDMADESYGNPTDKSDTDASGYANNETVNEPGATPYDPEAESILPGDNSNDDLSENNSTADSASNNDADSPNSEQTEEVPPKFPAIDFTLKDQYGNEHTLSDYKGKVVFLNFWTTWCPYCIEEMPDIEKIYNEYGKNQKDVIILGVANPSSDEYPYNQDVSRDEIIDFLEENGFTFPVVFDETGQVTMDYFISAYPTTFLIDKEGNIYGYAAAMLTKDIMDNVIRQALQATEE
ncbi:cytochrome c-type biogenesis protein [Herbinix hemicellulosilytica]|uniref:Thioredoxin domain-containing protein n=1 Tax=Herbinix hemicellulosilytica TaxID=1564487 RepID=A0A0H5SJN3_HERHM|nr:cytochrome c biogenesis protein/redoxin [Herbinix hemicellulosilytica]RBP56758.1 cytochrome c-type biogenesis protein [Herbinix hemicellulosilytica]CRZ35305.1 hypothetical protein HHT355_2107 [Herbinix hemicellulosilytica]